MFSFNRSPTGILDHVGKILNDMQVKSGTMAAYKSDLNMQALSKYLPFLCIFDVVNHRPDRVRIAGTAFTDIFNTELAGKTLEEFFSDHIKAEALDMDIFRPITEYPCILDIKRRLTSGRHTYPWHYNSRCFPLLGDSGSVDFIMAVLDYHPVNEPPSTIEWPRIEDVKTIELESIVYQDVGYGVPDIKPLTGTK